MDKDSASDSPAPSSSAQQEVKAPPTSDDSLVVPDSKQDETSRDLRQMDPSSSRPLDRCWSLSDGYSFRASRGRDDDEQDGLDEGADNDNGDGGATPPSDDEQSRFTVAWDEKDPMNPRNLSKARRWLIVLIISCGSLCV